MALQKVFARTYSNSGSAYHTVSPIKLIYTLLKNNYITHKHIKHIKHIKHLSETCGKFSMPMDKTARDRISTHMGAKLWANSFQTATLIFVMRLHVKKYI